MLKAIGVVCGWRLSAAGRLRSAGVAAATRDGAEGRRAAGSGCRVLLPPLLLQAVAVRAAAAAAAAARTLCAASLAAVALAHAQHLPVLPCLFLHRLQLQQRRLACALCCRVR